MSAPNQPAAFLKKLFEMVSDPATDHLIRWADDGMSFIVQKQEELARDLIPLFFKHNSFASFVRQLNMYGFKKISHINQGALIIDPSSESLEFKNEDFQRDNRQFLVNIKRKTHNKPNQTLPHSQSMSAYTADAHGRHMAAQVNSGLQHSTSAHNLITNGQSHNSNTHNSNGYANEPVGSPSHSQFGGYYSAPQINEQEQNNGSEYMYIMEELAELKASHLNLAENLHTLSQENTALWETTMQQKHLVDRQQATVDKIMRFLASVFMTKDNKQNHLHSKRKKLFLTGNDQTDTEGDKSDELDLSIPWSQDNIRERLQELIAPEAANIEAYSTTPTSSSSPRQANGIHSMLNTPTAARHSTSTVPSLVNTSKPLIQNMQSDLSNSAQSIDDLTDFLNFTSNSQTDAVSQLNEWMHDLSVPESQSQELPRTPPS